MTRENQYIDAVRAANRQVWDGINALVALQRQWNALDYGGSTNGQPNLPTAGVSAAEVGAVAFDTANALVAVLAQGHATNMAKLL